LRSPPGLPESEDESRACLAAANSGDYGMKKTIALLVWSLLLARANA
jgi:hypothetical protein